jgi:hypothetical protein
VRAKMAREGQAVEGGLDQVEHDEIWR